MTKSQSLLVFLLLLTFSHVFAQLTVSLPTTVNTCNSPYNMVVNPTGGTPPYYYSWSNGSMAQVITVSQSGSYTVVVSDASGATASATTNLIIAPTYSISPLASTQCLAVPMTLTMNGGTPPFSVDWGFSFIAGNNMELFYCLRIANKIKLQSPTTTCLSLRANEIKNFELEKPKFLNE